MQKVNLYRSTLLRVSALLLCLFVMGLIFYMSSRTATDSKAMSRGLLYSLLSFFRRGFSGMEDAAKETVVASWQHFIRKAAHFTLYGVLGLSLCVLSYGFPATHRGHFCRAWGVAVLYAISDEIHQAFVPGRGPGVGDVLIDASGALCGVLAVLLLARLVLRKAKRT